MFKLEKSQYCTHSSGYSVFVADREHVGYRDKFVFAFMEVDFLCAVVPLYIKTLKIEVKDPGCHFDNDVLIQRITDGLRFLEIQYELIN